MKQFIAVTFLILPLQGQAEVKPKHPCTPFNLEPTISIDRYGSINYAPGKGTCIPFNTILETQTIDVYGYELKLPRYTQPGEELKVCQSYVNGYEISKDQLKTVEIRPQVETRCGGFEVIYKDGLVTDFVDPDIQKVERIRNEIGLVEQKVIVAG